MNLQIHRVLNDITGVSGLRILDAILAGERAPLTLARLCHGGVKSSEDVIAKSLEGDYRPEHLFALRQSLAAFRYYQQLVLEADREIQLQLAELKTAATAQPTTPPRTKTNAHYAPPLRAENIRSPRWNYIESSESTSRMYQASVHSLLKRSYARSVQMFPGSEMPLLSHPGWGSARRRRSAAARCCSPKADAFEAALRPPCAWALNPYITPKTIWVNSSAVLPANSAGLRRSRPQRTNSLVSSFTC